MTRYRDLPQAYYEAVEGHPFPDPKPIWINTTLATSLSLDPDFLASPEGVAILSGQTSLDGTTPIAMAYSGHQFGHYAPLLGDGRARLVGETPSLEDDTRLHDIHLKGAGPTPFSRRGDGKATLGAAIREAIVSEGMAALGVPTTRALAILTTGENVHRQTDETGAILARTARAHIRVGSFQFAAANLEPEAVLALADWTRARLYPDTEDTAALFKAVCAAQGTLIAQWMGLGFLHGVMNTDNMMLSGETVDYGPCAFLDVFHPDKVFSAIDYYGRYAWNRQADIGQWNLARLAESLMPHITEEEAHAGLAEYAQVFEQAFSHKFQSKLGLSGVNQENFQEFLNETLAMLTTHDLDYTVFFAHLTRVARGEARPAPTWPENWVTQWQTLRATSPSLLSEMAAHNPVRIPRNHQIEAVIQAANGGNFAPFHTLMAALAKPYEDSPDYAAFEMPPNEDQAVKQTFCGT